MSQEQVMNVQSKKEGAQGIKLVWLMCIGIFLCMIDTTIMNIALPSIQQNLNVSLEKMSWVLNVYTMSIAVLAIPLGRFAELFGRGKVYVGGLVIFCLGSLTCAMAVNGDMLIASRFIQSIGAAILLTSSFTIGVSAMPIEKRGVALSILGIMQGLSAAMGPTIGGIITQNLSWKWIFLVNVPFSIVALVLVIRMLNLRNEPRVKARIDWIGLVLSSTAIFTLTLSLIKGGTWGWGSGKSLTCYAVAVISLIVFILIERRLPYAMVNLKLFRDRFFVGSSLLMIVGNVFLIGVMVLLPTFLTRMMDKTEFAAALMVTPISFMIFLMAPIASALIRIFGKTVVIISGFALMGFSYYLLSHLGTASSVSEIVVACLLLGTGYGLIVGPITVMSASNFEGEMLAASQSVIQMFRQVGMVLAISIFVALLTSNLKDSEANSLSYAKAQLDELKVDQTVKQNVTQRVQERINEQNVSVDNTGGKQEEAFVTPQERQRLIDLNVEQQLAKVPSGKREAAKAAIVTAVTKKVDDNIKQITDTLTAYSTKIKSYTVNAMANSFASLYHFFMPFIFCFALLGFIFVEKRVPVVREQQSKI
ncbi:MFS transporter [Paenibacillus pini]|uniref:Drug resistance transporter n=1 Tax=Paenibacillus pini JCM 16418 TaxID=1236976 RepID=W7YD31_9BACL|nr:MFS transporter [Paenibacillus pini]GAF06377.1 drug resistance transporter [Paenibacillus pini JCM 16418]